MSKINIDKLLEILPKLIREDDRVKGAIISALSGVVATHDDIVVLTNTMDKRFESMDKRFESMDKRFESMDKRFESIDQTMKVNYRELKFILTNIQSIIGKPFEQFGRNIIVKLLKSEGYADIILESKKLNDPERYVSEGITEVEIDGFSLDPPVIVEITSILRTKEKIDIFLKKKEFVEKEFECKFRGFFIAASSEFSTEEMGELTVKLREHNCELINL